MIVTLLLLTTFLSRQVLNELTMPKSSSTNSITDNNLESQRNANLLNQNKIILPEDSLNVDNPVLLLGNDK